MDELRKAIDGWWVSPEADIRGRWAIRRSGKVVEYVTGSDEAYERMSELRWQAVRDVMNTMMEQSGEPVAWLYRGHLRDILEFDRLPERYRSAYDSETPLAPVVVSRDSIVHAQHCNQGEYIGSCKYQDDDCPEIVEPIPANVYFDATMNTFWRQDNLKSLTDVTNQYWGRFVDRREEFPPLPKKWQ